MDFVFEDIGVYQEVMDNFFQPEFDAKKALRATSSSPEKCLPTIDEFESQLVRDNPELAKVICELDSVGNKGKKQELRERVVRLQAMTKEGRELFEKRKKCVMRTVLQSMKSDWSSGPMSLLYRAIKEKLRLEVRIRTLNRVDRIAHGFLVAFDKHLNVVLRDVDEFALPGRKEERSFGRRKPEHCYLPLGMIWRAGGQWPWPLGKCRVVLERHISCSFIKGDTIVLIRAFV